MGEAKTILRRFVISLTNAGRNRETQLSINHDELRALLREAQTLFAKEATDGE